MEGYANLDDLVGRTGGLPPGGRKIALPTDILFESMNRSSRNRLASA